MKDNLKIHYDKEADFLEIGIGKPVKGYFKNLGKGIFERREEKTDEIKGYAVFSFLKRVNKIDDFNIPLSNKIKIISS